MDIKKLLMADKLTVTKIIAKKSKVNQCIPTLVFLLNSTMTNRSMMRIVPTPQQRDTGGTSGF